MCPRRVGLLAAVGLLSCASDVDWADSPVLTDTWKAVSTNDFNTLLALVVSQESEFVHHRASDGRGPLWWAFEFKNPSALALCKHFGVSETDRDAHGLLPPDVFTGSSEELAELVYEADQRVPGIPAMLQQFADKLEEMKRQQAERFEDGDDGTDFVDDGAPDRSYDGGDDYDDDENVDDEEDEEKEEEDEEDEEEKDISAKVAALKAKAAALKDEV